MPRMGKKLKKASKKEKNIHFSEQNEQIMNNQKFYLQNMQDINRKHYTSNSYFGIPKRQTRYNFTLTQLEIMHDNFLENPYPNSQEIDEMAAQFGIPSKKVSVINP